MTENQASPLGYDLRPPNPKSRMLDHVHESPHYWTFCHGPDVLDEGPTLDVPKTMAKTRPEAEAIAGLILRYAGVAWDAGVEAGARDLQRFYRIAFGMQAPDKSEALHWQIPVPLAPDPEGPPRSGFTRQGDEAKAYGWCDD